MDDPQQEALLEAVRKLRGEVRGVKMAVKHASILLVLCVAAVAMHVNWFFESLIGVALGSGIVVLLWFGKEIFSAWRADRKRKVSPGVITVTRAP